MFDDNFSLKGECNLTIVFFFVFALLHFDQDNHCIDNKCVVNCKFSKKKYFYTRMTMNIVSFILFHSFLLL